VILSEVT